MAKRGLYANINAKRAAGKPMRKKGAKGAPSDADFKRSAKTAGKPKAGESEKMTKKRASFMARHGANIKKGKMSAAYWADKVKW